MEQMMDRMQDENTGIPVRTVNKFRAKVPSVFTGNFLTHLCYFIYQSPANNNKVWFILSLDIWNFLIPLDFKISRFYNTLYINY